MTDKEIQDWNESTDKNEAIALADAKAESASLLSKLKMPEDVAIRSNKLTGLRVTDEFLLGEARARSDNFEYDPDRRLAAAIEQRDAQRKKEADDQRKRGRIRVMKTSTTKRRNDEKAVTLQMRIDDRALLRRQRLGLDMVEVPGTPLPQSPPLRVPHK